MQVSIVYVIASRKEVVEGGGGEDDREAGSNCILLPSSYTLWCGQK